MTPEALFNFDERDFAHLLPTQELAPLSVADPSDFDLVTELLSSSSAGSETKHDSRPEEARKLVSMAEEMDELPEIDLVISGDDVPFDPLLPGEQGREFELSETLVKEEPILESTLAELREGGGASAADVISVFLQKGDVVRDTTPPSSRLKPPSPKKKQLPRSQPQKTSVRSQLEACLSNQTVKMPTPASAAATVAALPDQMQWGQHSELDIPRPPLQNISLNHLSRPKHSNITSSQASPVRPSTTGTPPVSPRTTSPAAQTANQTIAPSLPHSQQNHVPSSTLPELTPEERKLLASMPPNSALAQIALNHIPSSTNSASNQVNPIPPTAAAATVGLSDAPASLPTGPAASSGSNSQSKMRYSEGATASNYCHVCGRASNTIELAACANTRIGLCRKVMCDKCLLLHQRSLFYFAKQPNSSWICMHCRNICPKRARCHQYQKNNLRRRLRNEQRAKALSAKTLQSNKENTKPKTLKGKKPTQKTPVAGSTPVANGRIVKSDTAKKEVSHLQIQTVDTTSTALGLSATQTMRSDNPSSVIKSNSNTTLPTSESLSAEVVNAMRLAASRALPGQLAHLQQHGNHLQTPSLDPQASLQMVNLPTGFPLAMKHHAQDMNKVSPTGVSSMTFSNSSSL